MHLIVVKCSGNVIDLLPVVSQAYTYFMDVRELHYVLLSTLLFQFDIIYIILSIYFKLNNDFFRWILKRTIFFTSFNLLQHLFPCAICLKILLDIIKLLTFFVFSSFPSLSPSLISLAILAGSCRTAVDQLSWKLWQQNKGE